MAGPFQSPGDQPRAPAGGWAASLLRRRGPPRSYNRTRLPNARTALRYRDGFLIALTYGREVDWVKERHCRGRLPLIHRRRVVNLAGPRVLSLQEVPAIPLPGWIRGILQLLRVDEVVHLQLGRLPERVR
jgi:hypothetical protein